MSTKVHVTIDSGEKVAKRLKMDPGGPGELFLATEVRRQCDPYVPMQQGILKNTAEVKPGSVTYTQVYADKQYRENKGSGLRGKFWDVRMMADKGAEVVAAVAKFLGGKPG